MLDELSPSRRAATASPPWYRQAFGLGPLLLGAIVLLGWALDVPALKTALPGSTTMKANTALGFVASASGILLVSRSSNTGALLLRPLLASLAGLAAFLIGALTLFEYGSGSSLGLDELLFADPNTTSPPYPGRMSPATAAAFSCAGAAVLFLVQAASASRASNRYRQRCAAAAHLLAAVPAGVGYLALAGYAYQVEGLYSFGTFVIVAIHTAVGFALLAPAILLTEPDLGWRRAFADHPVARGSLKRLLPLSLALPFLAGLAVVWGARARVYDPLYGPVLFALAAAAASVSIAWTAALIVRRAERALSEGEARLRLALDAGELGAYDWDLRTNLVRPATRTRAIFAFTRAEGTHSNDYFARILPEDTERTRATVEQGLVAGRVAARYRIRLSNGEIRHVLSRGDVLRDENGVPARLIGVLSDETERERGEAALRESEARFRHMADSAPALIWMTDAMAQVTFANMYHEYLFGRPIADILGEGWAQILLPADRGQHTDLFAAAFAARLPFRAETRVRDKEGRVRWMRCEGVPRLNDAGIFLGYTACGVDITEARLAAGELERRIAERTAELNRALGQLQQEILERERTENALRQSQKMEAVGQLTGGIAHDFNNMLQVIGGSLEMLRRRVDQGRASEAGRFVDSASATVTRAAALTQRLLAFARRQALQPEPVVVDTLIRGMEELLLRTAGPAITVRLAFSDGAWPVLCDPNQLENILLNLAINARDAMPDGGQLTLTTRHIHLSDADVTNHDGSTPGDFVEIAVADTGVGMDDATQARAFEPFFTTKPLGQGTGLGLSQLYGFVRQSGGVVRLDSAPGRGTTVSVFLPRHDQAHSRGDEMASDEEPSATGQGEALLLVEDEAEVRALTAEHLRELGYDVVEAADGLEATRVLQSSRRVNLLITDVGLPGGMNGRQVADAARERWPGLPAIFITGYAGSVLSGQLAPGMDVIGKPFELDALAAKVRVMLDTAPGATEQ